MIAATLTPEHNLFGGTVVLLMAYCLFLLISVAYSVASQYENESSGEIPGSRRVTG